MGHGTVLCGTPAIEPGFVSLTFDDGPGPESAQLARMLHGAGVPATFFVLGESLRMYGEALDTYRDCGHVIALHGERHVPFTTPGLAKAQLDRCRGRVRDRLGRTVWFRPPYGLADAPVPGYAGPVGWHASGEDWQITYREGQTVEGCVERVLEGLAASGGGIVLLHDFAPRSEFARRGLAEQDLDLRVLQVSELLVARLRDSGYSFTALPEPAEVR